MTADRKSLIAVAAELNEKKDAGIKNPSKLSTDRLVAAILAATDNGTDLKKLSKEARATITALVNSAPAEPQEEAPAEGAPEAPAAEEPAPAEDAEEDGPAEPEDLTSRAALNLAAQDMNDVMGLEPGIDTTLDDAMFMKSFTKAAEMATGTDNFKEYTWQVLGANQLGPERILPAPIKKGGSTAKKAENAPAGEKRKKEKAPKATKGPGVISTIRTFVAERAAAEDNTFTLQEILENLAKAFPERDEDALMSTVRTQVPGRVRKELGYSFDKLENGKFKVTAPAAK